MFDISLLSKSIAKGFRPLDDGDDEVIYIGTLNSAINTIKFVHNADAIYANGIPIITTCNCAWTAAQSFALTMQAVFGEDFLANEDENFKV
jgi:hypothetical protein